MYLHCCLQLTHLLQHLQRQQQQYHQHQQLLVLLDSAAAAAASDTQVQRRSGEQLHQLPQQLADLVAAYGGQLQVLPEQQQQAGPGDTVPASVAAPARSVEPGNLGEHHDELVVLMARLAAKQPPPEVLRAAAAEAEKLRQGGETQPGAAEARAHLELLAYLPWPAGAQQQEQEQQAPVRSNTETPPEPQQQEIILGNHEAFHRLLEKERIHHAAGAEQNSSSSSNSNSNSSDVGALLLSGLGQAGRAAAGAATAAAGAVLNVIEGAAMATVAALAAYDQQGVEVAADLPDTSLRPR